MGREDLIEGKPRGKTNYRELSAPSTNANKKPIASYTTFEEGKEIQHKLANV